MENLTPLPHSLPNPSIQTLPISPTNHIATQEKNAMKNFQELVLKLAGTHSNKPLNPAAETLLQCRLNRFVLDYKTPDHPPYSSMIETALQELNEKTGSSLESISQHLEKNYDNLPFGHSVLLKHHLEKMGETGEVAVAHDKRYGLPGHLEVTTKVKKRGRRRKWRYESERNSHDRRKHKLIKQRDSQKCGKRRGEYDEKEQGVAENGSVCVEEMSQQLETEPPGFESINVENLHRPISTELELESAGSSSRALRWQNRLHRKLTAQNLTSLKSSTEMETYQDQQKAFDSSPITMSNGDELQPKYRRIRVLLKPKPDTAAVENVLLHCNAKQTLQPKKRRPGRPPKRVVVT